LDPDLAARIEGVRDLILTAGSGSDGSGRLGARGGGAGHRRLVSVAVRGSGSPNFAKSDAPVAKSSGSWVWDGLRDLHNPPRALAGLGVLEACTRSGRGGSVQWRSPARGVKSELWSTTLSAKGQERAVVLTEGSTWLEKQRRVAGGVVRAAGRRGARGGGQCRGSLGFWAPRVDSWCSCGGATGVKRVGEPPAARDRSGREGEREREHVCCWAERGDGLGRCEKEREWAAGRTGLLSYFLSFCFSNELKSI
jgi:hypothetical protein